MDARYINAVSVLPKQNKVCGRTILPFCLRHRIALEAIKSPFLNPNATKFNPVDVINAVKILSTYDKEGMVEPLSLRDKYHLLLLVFSVKKMVKSVGTIMGIMNISCSYPKTWDKKQGAKNNVPWVLGCVSNLVRNGCTMEEAWTMPEGEAIWMALSHSIYEGAKIDILTTDEEKELESFHDRVNAYKKKMNIN
jgi:hypothetical protein